MRLFRVVLSLSLFVLLGCYAQPDDYTVMLNNKNFAKFSYKKRDVGGKGGITVSEGALNKKLGYEIVRYFEIRDEQEEAWKKLKDMDNGLCEERALYKICTAVEKCRDVVKKWLGCGIVCIIKKVQFCGLEKRELDSEIEDLGNWISQLKIAEKKLKNLRDGQGQALGDEDDFTEVFEEAYGLHQGFLGADEVK